MKNKIKKWLKKVFCLHWKVEEEKSAFYGGRIFACKNCDKNIYWYYADGKNDYIATTKGRKKD